MKNNSYYTSFEKYQLNPVGRYTENKYLNNNSNSNNMSFETQNNYLKRSEPEPYPTLVSEPSKSNKNLKNLTNNNPSYNKNYFYRDYYETEVYQPQQYEYGTYEGYDYRSNWSMRPFDLYTQSTKNNEYKKNMYNAEDDSFQSNNKNHSYYESKYSKKKNNAPRALKNNTINNYRKNTNPTQINGKYTISNISLNKNANKSNIINKTGDNKYVINNSPTIKRKNETYFYNLQNNNTINIDKKKNLTLKNSSLINDINRLKQSNNNTIISTVIQPRTPSVYSHHTIRSPFKKLDDEIYIPNSKNIYYDKTERNLPSKSLEKMAFRKLVFNYQNTLNNMNKDESDYNKLNMTDKYNLKANKVPYTPKQFRVKNLTNIYKTVNEDNKNPISNITININNRNEDKNKLLTNNTESYIIEHNKNQTEINSKQSNQIKDEKNLPKEINDKKTIKPPIKEIYVKNINNKNNSPKNDSVKKVISKIKSNKNDININKNKVSITNNNKIVPSTNNKIIPTKQKSIINEKYMKEVKNIMNDNSVEPTIQNKYTFEIKPRNSINYSKEIVNNSNLNFFNISKGKDEQNKDIMNKRYSHVLPMTEIKKTFTSEVIDFSNKNKNNQILHSISGLPNLNNLDKDDKIKSQEIRTNKKANNIINNNKMSTSKKNIKEDISKTEQKKITNLSKKNLFNTIPIKQLNQPEKISNPFPKVNPTKENLSSLIKNEKEKVKEKVKEKEKERPHRFQSEMLKYESRAREKSIKKEEKKDDEWGDIEFKGMRKTTYDVGRRGKKNKDTKKNKINDEFHSTIYIKKSEALTIPGKNEYGNRKTNQDTYILEKNVNGVLNFNIFGVLDGHGDNGHFASQFVSRYVIYRIKNHPSIKKLDEPKEIYNKLIANGYEIIANIYLDADVQIKKEKFDVTRSGTTIVLVIQLEEHIICANTGDSRAIAIYDNSYDDNKLIHSKIYPLSYDCKPDLPNEKKRITECGGVVEKAYYSDEEEDDDEIPYRVWAKGEDYPGLAMSRSIGDMDAKKVGVIPNPQIVTFTIDYFSKYIVMGSDGIWEFISNEDAMKIANKFYLRNDPMGLCHELVNKATKLWEEKDVVIDDITVLVIFF